MKISALQYSGDDLAVLIPTKDRPEQIKTLLQGIAEQSVSCGRIIIVATGKDISSEVMAFSDCLPVEYHYSETPGQIRQRNIGISLLNQQTKLVACLDDDIALTPTAFEEMINFWNQIEPNTAGVGFNITNEAAFRFSALKYILGLGGSRPGQVLRSGANMSIASVKKTIRSHWLNGGATVWRQAVLKDNPYKEIDTRWAVYEDVIFSYPLGKQYPLYICATAKVAHHHIIQPISDESIYRFRGRTTALWHLYFVCQNRDLSILAYIWKIVMISTAGCLIGGLFRSKRPLLEQHIGAFEGMLLGVKSIIQKKEIIRLL